MIIEFNFICLGTVVISITCFILEFDIFVIHGKELNNEFIDTKSCSYIDLRCYFCTVIDR